MPDDSTLKELYDRPSWFEGGEPGGYENYDEQTEPVLPIFNDLLERWHRTRPAGSILDLGCGYGTHLAHAAARGWKCFGVEISEHARNIVRQRHGNNIYVTDRAESLVPHQFDLILLFDFLEHLNNPYSVFFQLFSRGAITPETRIVITTPNARSNDALRDPARWVYRHPPSHLVYFSGDSLRVFLSKLHFSQVEISGIHPLGENIQAGYNDERSALNRSLQGFGGLRCEAQGSDFMDFMHERYVPGTWSKITEYEHVPRYLFARQFARDARVLDFGSGTGYGSALLADTSRSVVGVDIDAAALEWARQAHKHPRLKFEMRSDLGEGMPAASFDLITCFEVIEHLDEATQSRLVMNFARLLARDGLLLISTPNPAVTANYGENPFHLKEMTRQEFESLLKSRYRQVMILDQWIRHSVTIAQGPDGPAIPAAQGLSKSVPKDVSVLPANYVAICTQSAIAPLDSFCFFDNSADYIGETIAAEKRHSQSQADAYREWEIASDRQRHVVALQKELQVVSSKLAALEQQRSVHVAMINAKDAEIAAFKVSKIGRLRDAVHQPLSVRKIARIGYLVAAMATPEIIRRSLRPYVRRVKGLSAQPGPAAPAISAYRVRSLHPAREQRKRVVHAIANFMTGGSSRLVVDLIERLGHMYQQEVITSYVPNPPAYEGILVHEFSYFSGVEPILEYLERFRPALLHAHYWGDCDAPWYEEVFAAAMKYGCKIIENVNTPVQPYVCPSIERYVFVSDFVAHTFGQPGKRNLRIYPGTDLALFSRSQVEAPEDCIGMVYRLEQDKLNQNSIDVFIKVAARRPTTKVLIVGGGSLFESYRKKVQSAGVMSNFDFTGYVAYESLPELYKKMSVFVAPVWKESFGQVTSMAMNLGIPVVGYQVGALPEIVDDPELLAPAGDSDALSEVIIGLLDDRKRRISIGNRNRRRAQELFSIDAMVAEFERLYAELLGVPS
jgi:glycosyltransferase involved in cell wall biosynthesis/2-polyprenyl-3-methyl-5-hydroxy-6-metoxy-1,4-benzoquinol methylase